MLIGPNILQDVGALSYVGVFVLSLLTNFFIPVPEEIILLALGYVIATGAFSGFVVIPIMIFGLLISDVVLFLLAKRGSRGVHFLYKKFFAKRLEKHGGRWLSLNITRIIVISRFLVQFRFLGPFLAGERQVATKTFITYDLLALVIYVPLYIFLGIFFHAKVQYIIDKVGVARNIILMVVIVFAILALFKVVYRFLFPESSPVPDEKLPD